MLTDPENCDTPWRNFMRVFGLTTGFFVVFLELILICSYVLMVRALNQFTKKEMKHYQKSVTILFLLFLFSYSIRAAYLFGEGHYAFLSEF